MQCMAWLILGAETISIPKHRDSILSILDTMELRRLLNPLKLSILAACRAISRADGNMFSVNKFRNIGQVVSKSKQSKSQVSNIENSQYHGTFDT